jgi:type VI protein secretion system component Hcp
MRQNETIIKHSTWYKRGQNETIIKHSTWYKRGQNETIIKHIKLKMSITDSTETVIEHMCSGRISN